jgi:oxaloacetate decarboxylase beta subunit
MKSFIQFITIVFFFSVSGITSAQSVSGSSADSVIAKANFQTSTALITTNETTKAEKPAILDPSSLVRNGGVKLVMMILGLALVLLSIKYNYQPLLLVPIGVGMLISNIPFFVTGYNQFDIFEENSFFNIFYKGLSYGIYPSLIFIGIGAMTDFSSLIANPKLMLLGAVSQIGVFAAFVAANSFGFDMHAAASIGLIGTADGPISIFASSKLSPEILVPVAISAYAFMAMVPIIQPPIMRLLTSKKERTIRMKPQRAVSYNEKILFPVVGLVLTGIIVPKALPVLGLLFFGNILKESGGTKRLAFTASNTLLDIVTILLGLTLGAAAQPEIILSNKTLMIFVFGGGAFVLATISGVLFAKLMNVFLSKENKINPLIGNAGVSAMPDSARVSQMEGLKADPSNHLLTHAMAPNVAGVIGSAVAAGILMSFLM